MPLSLLKDKHFSEVDVFKRIQQGDETALAQVYKKFYRMIVKMIVRNSGSEESARDIYQDALVIFWQNARSGKLVMSSKMSTYIYSICKNLWLKELRKMNRHSPIDNHQDIVGQEDSDWEERDAIIAKCMDALSPTCKKILTCFYFDGMSMIEIVKEIGLANADTAKSLKYKCKEKLNELVKRHFSEQDFF